MVITGAAVLLTLALANGCTTEPGSQTPIEPVPPPGSQPIDPVPPPAARPDLPEVETPSPPPSYLLPTADGKFVPTVLHASSKPSAEE
jgi:hypothetical protein